MTKPTEKLIARLIDEGFLSPGQYRYVRSYAGYWQVKEGAWSFWIENSEGRDILGSQYSVQELLRAKKIVDDNTGSLYPE